MRTTLNGWLTALVGAAADRGRLRRRDPRRRQQHGFPIPSSSSWQRFPRQERLSGFSERRRRRRPVGASRTGRQGIQGRGVGDQHQLRSDRRPAGGQGRGRFASLRSVLPGTFRIYGPESNLAAFSLIQGLDLRNTARTASDDARIHPRPRHALAGVARQADLPIPDRPERAILRRQPVTADDVVASWEFVMDKGLQEPMSQLVYGKFEKPVAESKYIVSVKSKVLNWRNFLYFSASLPILPAHVLKNVDGAPLHQGIQLQAAARERAVHSSMKPISSRAGQSRCDDGPITGRRNSDATSARQLRRDSRSDRSRRQPRLRDVQEGRP